MAIQPEKRCWQKQTKKCKTRFCCQGKSIHRWQKVLVFIKFINLHAKYLTDSKYLLHRTFNYFKKYQKCAYKFGLKVQQYFIISSYDVLMQNLMHCLFHDTHLLELFHIRFSHFQARRGSSQASYAWQFDVKSCLRIGLGRWYLDHYLPSYKNVHKKLPKLTNWTLANSWKKWKLLVLYQNGLGWKT